MHSGREKKLLVLLGVKKKKKENDPLINESNCSKLIEYIIHRHPLAACPLTRYTAVENDMQFGRCRHPFPDHPFLPSLVLAPATVRGTYRGYLWSTGDAPRVPCPSVRRSCCIICTTYTPN